ncbi:PIG-L family deacetylase [uncultured Aliiroseovarius sp.]|uniref:PIG-L family deacetylase n=1 Tax=uncultured Aliiroseovarius sp. TaxID=1658783 RepID=UPI0025996B1C|nr:PIG-L family deacetylase [uncultured Aliiroseovarius sp.]
MAIHPHARLTQDRLHPRITDLWFALRGLGSVAGFMQSGAHPDDETSAMMAALRFRDGLSTSYACSTRGEGGQNDLGTEAGTNLGTLRTAEMERACERLDMRMWWLSVSPDDLITDFGFSKSGAETLGKWGRDRTLARFVDIVRRERPDAICPTFLDVPGQHGHHRAMTEAAHLVMQAAADPSFTDCDLPVWTISKLYLPAWGGGGGAYDDELPPPPATVTVPGKGTDPVTGWSWERIGQHSRMYHTTQGMGQWMAPADERDWPLHLAESRVGADRGAITDNLPTDLADLGLPAAARALAETQAAFPDTGAIFAAAANALSLIRAGTDTVAPEHRHRLTRKQAELARVLRIASETQVHGLPDTALLRPGETTRLAIEHRPATYGTSTIAVLLPDGWQQSGDRIGPKADTSPSDPYPTLWDPLAPARPALAVTLHTDKIEATSEVPLDVTPLVAPPVAATLSDTKQLINLAKPLAPIRLRLRDVHPADATPALTLPSGWGQDWSGSGVTLTPPADLSAGLTTAPLTLDHHPATTERLISHPHVAPRLSCAPAVLKLRAVSVDLPQVRTGYIGAGNDRLDHWLSAMGLMPKILDNQLGDTDALNDIDSLVIGVFAFRARPGLAAFAPRLRSWVEDGGTLVTLYHRPWDAWDPDTIPPRRIEIGQPSLRWRVTDETAQVTHLAPGHPVLNAPNQIGPEDWAGWVKERGLYFAKSWDDAYQPLLAMADPDERPLHGALLSGDIGKGRHNHVALGLHVQMENLVPGAFRLMANLLARR